MKKSFSISDEFISSRLDRWFKLNVCDVPQSLIEKNIRKGNIKVNNIKKKSSYRLQAKDKVTIKNINLSPSSHKLVNKKYVATTKDIKKTNSIFIENNENFVVINKPSGISVQSGTKSKRNILDILRYTKEFEGSSPYTVHRIDKETTGLLIVAKNRKYAQLFTSLFRLRKIYKTYLGIIVGAMSNEKGELRHELFYNEGNKKIKTLAITKYSVMDTNNNYSLLKLNPETGRKHQLRKQLLINGNPILGDAKYRLFENRTNKNLALMLHAYKIHFSIAGQRYNFLAELPDNFKKTLKEKYLKIF